MTPREFLKAIRKLEREIGESAHISVLLNYSFSKASDPAFRCSIHPNGFRGDRELTIEADEFEDIVRLAREKWSAHREEYRKQTVRKMALAIIKITAALGHCTDAALRQEFPEKEVKDWAAEACADANVIAEKGPFQVVTLGGGNGAPREVAADARSH